MELGANSYGRFDLPEVATEVARTRRDGHDELGPYAVLETRAATAPLA